MRRAAPVLLALTAAVALVGCGATTSTDVAAKTDAMVAFAKCMRANGVPNFPDPGTNGSGGVVIQAREGTPQNLTVNGVSVNGPAFKSAMQRCQSKLPNGGQPPVLSAARKAAMLKFSQCMRTHGLTNFPDPSFAPGGGVRLSVGPKAGLDPNSPVFQQAQAACAKDQPHGQFFKAP